jgi:lactate dehydrogenase-like 2-hydroxyacid dehydrogenase
MSKRHVVVTCAPSAEMRQAFAEALDNVAVLTDLSDVGQDERRRALASADAALSWNLDGELEDPGELRLLESVGLVQPFLDLPNVIGSPHNSAITAGSLATAARCAAENLARYLQGEPAEHLVDRSEYVRQLAGDGSR